MPPLDLLVRRAGAASSSTAPLVTATSAVSVLSFSTRAASSTSAAAPTAAPASSGGWLRALFGGGASSKKKGHRPYGQHEADHVTLATRKKDKVLEGNPGARVEPAFLPAEEAQALAAEAKEVMQKFGIAHLSEEQRQFMAGQMKHFPLPKKDLAGLINMQRVTGRFESEAQTLAPWGYGDDFNIDRVPPLLRKTLEKIQDSPHFALGKPRDITLNYRNQYFYRLDPHIDPPKDGGNVFILGLLSGTVLTLSPLSRTMAPAQFTHMNQRNVAEKSYNPGKVRFGGREGGGGVDGCLRRIHPCTPPIHTHRTWTWTCPSAPSCTFPGQPGTRGHTAFDWA